MLESSSKVDEGSFPNIIFKKKLAPLPLFKQNNFNKTLTPSSSMEKSCFGFRSAGLPTVLPPGSPTKTFLNELKTINHYGRLCDQPFLEFSNFHFEQVFGSGSGKKKIVLEPVQKKKDKKVITKLYTIGDFNKSMRASTIRIDDNATSPSQKAKKQKAKKENHSIIKKVYQIGEFETIVAFYSLEVVLVPVDENSASAPISLRIGQKELKRIYLKPHSEMAQTVLDSLTYSDERLAANITKESSEPKSGLTPSDHSYPDKKENLAVTLNDQKYKATIHFPYLEVLIPGMDFKQKLMLKPIQLSNLYEAKFSNLDDYIQRFDLPAKVYKNKDDLRADGLKELPTVIKKVIKTPTFGGLMLFKGLEVHLRNTSDAQPETIMHESTLTPMNKNILNRKKKDVSNVLLRLNIYDLERTHKCTAEELVQLISESISIQEGEGFTLNLSDEKTNAYHHRHQIKEDSLPEFSEKFNIRFNKFVYECFVKFPTLELYVPETNFKDVIQLKPSQLKDLIDNSFGNMESYIELFKTPPPPSSRRSVMSSSPLEIKQEKVHSQRSFETPEVLRTEETPRESEAQETPVPDRTLETVKSLEYVAGKSLAQMNEKITEETEGLGTERKGLSTVVKKVIKTPNFGGLMLFKGLEVHLRNTSDARLETVESESNSIPMSKNSSKRKKKDLNNVLLRLDVHNLERTHKCTADELVQLISESISFQEGEGFTLNLSDEKTNAYHQRNEVKEDSLPEFSEKFNLNLNKSVYECFVKFSTLEVYVPETNFKDVILLKPSQLKDLIDTSFGNMESYIELFKTPPPPSSRRSIISDSPLEIKQEKVSKE